MDIVFVLVSHLMVFAIGIGGLCGTTRKPLFIRSENTNSKETVPEIDFCSTLENLFVTRLHFASSANARIDQNNDNFNNTF